MRSLKGVSFQWIHPFLGNKMPRRERPYLILQQNQFRESYELHVNDFIRGSKVIQVSTCLLILFVGCIGYSINLIE